MVGYEPELNPPVDWEKELREFLRKIDADSDEDFDESMLNPKPLSLPRKVEVIHETENVEFKERLATPLIQIFSVSVSSTFDDGKPCQLFGSIRLMEGTNPRFYLYDHDCNDPEIQGEQWNLSLIGADGGVIVPSLSTVLDFCLKDKVRGVDVVKGKLDFDLVPEDSYDRLLMGVVRGPYGVANVCYVVFRFALYGTVRIIVSKNDHNDKECNAAEIYGSVVAGYENSKVYCVDDEKKLKYLETRLFDTPSNRPLAIMVGTPIKLSRNEVAVPTYSSVTIKVDLWDSNGRIADGFLKFPAYKLGDAIQYIQTQNARVEVRLRWWHAYDHLYNRPKLEDGGQLQKNPKVLEDQHSSTSLVPRSLTSTPRVLKDYGRAKVEVFTVFVGGITKDVSNLCGTILVDEGSDRYSIYNRDENDAEVLADHKLVRIDVNYRAIQNDEFYVILNLKDPVRKLEVSRGSLSWNICRLVTNMLWYSKRLCSVVRGKDGYAAVHYEIFQSAFEAHLEVKLCGKGNPDSLIGLYGTLIARYGDHNYSTSYQKKYFSSLLFECPKNKTAEVKLSSKVEMLRSIVVVPSKSSLIIEANLGIVCLNNIDKLVHGMTEFNIEFNINTITSTTKRIPGEDYWIEIKVEFRR